MAEPDALLDGGEERGAARVSTKTPIVLVRHGETPWNVAGRWQGQADPGLTDAGRAQARDVGATFAREAHHRWARVVSSDLARARLTAEAIADATGLPLVLEPRLRERDVRRWSGLTRDEVAAQEPELLAAFRAGDPDVRPGGGENTLDVRARALGVLADLVRAHPGEPAILVTHLGLIRSIVPGADSANGGRTRSVAEALLETHRLEVARVSRAGDTIL